MAYDVTKDPNLLTSSLVDSQARSLTTITPSDTVDLTIYQKALYVGVAGDLSVIPVNQSTDTAVVLKNHPVGYVPIQVRRVMATGTTATSIVGLGD